MHTRAAEAASGLTRLWAVTFLVRWDVVIETSRWQAVSMNRYITVARLLELCSKAGRASSHYSRTDSARYQLRDSQRVPCSRKILVHVEVPSIRGRAHVNSMLMQLWNI